MGRKEGRQGALEQTLKALQNLALDKILIGAAVLVLCLVLSRILMRLFGRFLDRAKQIDPSLHSMLKAMLRFVLYFISILFAANVLSIPISSFLALFSVVGLAISLAVQGVLNNFAGGIIILASKPFTLGDYIEADTVAGTVREIGILHTRMISPDGKMIFVPNNLLYTSKLINYTSSGARRIDLEISAAYHNTPEQVRSAALEAVASVPAILSEPAPQVLVERYDDSAICYTVRCWAHSNDYNDARYALNEAIYTSFDRSGVEMTYPHMNVHVQSL